MSTAEIERVYRELRVAYLAEAPARLTELRKDVAAFSAGEADAAASLRTRFHRLAGSGGSYGFPEVGRVARELEHFLDTGPVPGPETATRLEAGITAIVRAFDAGAAELGQAPVSVVDRRPEFTWRALVVAPEGRVRGRIAAALRSAGFEPVLQAPDGVHATSHADRPDLVVLVADGGSEAPYALAAAWTSTAIGRPRAVVLVEAGGTIDRLRAVAAGADLVLVEEQVDSELPRFARTMARIGAPPPRVLVVHPDRVASGLLASHLEHAGIRVTQAASAGEAQDAAEAEFPDLVLLASRLPDADGLTFARLLRQDPRFHLVPLVLLAASGAVPEEIAALRAGADDFLPQPVDPALLLQVVVSRAERGRRLREMVHRDGLTGLLNHATLMAELEFAVESARRNGGSFALLLLDLDHFRRVNDRYGHLVGDQVLFHVAALLRSQVRASDLVGRYGGEEFAVVLQGCTPEGAVLVAHKLHQRVGASPAETRDGASVPVRASVGAAVFPEHGVTAAELAHAADRALFAAKTGGRDRVVFAAAVPREGA